MEKARCYCLERKHSAWKSSSHHFLDSGPKLRPQHPQIERGNYKRSTSRRERHICMKCLASKVLAIIIM